jgi:hypothetical protein
MMTDKNVLNEEEGGTPAPAPSNVTGGVAGKDNTDFPMMRRKREELADSVARAKESAHRMVKMKDKQ